LVRGEGKVAASIVRAGVVGTLGREDRGGGGVGSAMETIGMAEQEIAKMRATLVDVQQELRGLLAPV